MDIAPSRELKTGKVIEGTFDVVERSAVPAAIFVVIMALANGAIAYFGVDYSSVPQQLAQTVIAFIVAIIAAYLLFDAMLRKSGFIREDADDVILPYAGLSILYSIAVGIGFLLIIFPGLYFMSRWSVAQPVLIAQGKGVIASMKDSWERTRGSEFAILVAVLVLVVLPGVASMLIGTQFEPDNLIGISVTQGLSAVASMLGIAMGVALYKLIVFDRDGGTAKTFE